MPQPPRPNMPTNGERVRTSGLCWLCDFNFINEVVARYPEPSMPGGWPYIELRHLDATTIDALHAPSTSPQDDLVSRAGGTASADAMAVVSDG
jgi:hypothetical protein